MMNDKIVVFTGSIADRVRFWGPFDNHDDADKFMQTVHPSLPCDWAYLEEPPTETPQEGIIEGVIIEETVGDRELVSIPKIKRIKEKGNVIPFPEILETDEIKDDAGKTIGFQVRVPGA